MDPQEVPLGSAIYLNNIDDFNGRSQSCINPIFTSDIRSSSSKLNMNEVNVSDIPSSTKSNSVRSNLPLHQQHHRSGGIRSRRGRPWADVRSGTATSSTKQPMVAAVESNDSIPASIRKIGDSKISEVVTATIADCLACSGCITTAETVILQEQHSLQKLKVHLFSSFPSKKHGDTDDTLKGSDVQLLTPKQKVTVVTISPASIADLCRYLLHPGHHHDSEHESSAVQKERLLLQLSTVLYRYLNVSAIMDGTVALHTTLQIAAEEFSHTFCANYSNHQKQQPSVPKDELYERRFLPSIALSSRQTQYWIPPSSVNSGNDTVLAAKTTTMEVVDRSACTKRIQQSLPILSSSCPAIVCLVEKSYPQMVSHLSTTISPMIAAARQFWKPIVTTLFDKEVTINKNILGTNVHADFFHLAVMPCHDKKLEASRNDFRDPYVVGDQNQESSSSTTTLPIVDMVITTMELIQLLHDAITSQQMDDVTMNTQQKNGSSTNNNSIYDIVRQAMQSVTITSKDSTKHLPISVDCNVLVTSQFPFATKSAFEEMLQQQLKVDFHRNRPYLFTMKVKARSLENTAITSTALTTSSPRNVTGSGGYADYIFRYTAKQIFGLDCPNDSSIWIPIIDHKNVMNQRHGNHPKTNVGFPDGVSHAPIRMSARTASQRKQREYYEAIIFRNNHTLHYSIATTLTNAAEMRSDSTIVLRFVIAYGMSLVQNVLSHWTRSEDGQPQSPAKNYDYIECMACTHSCLNGNGQIRRSDNVGVRETPSDTKLRVQRTHNYFPIQQYHDTASEAVMKGYSNSNGDTAMMMSTTSGEDLYQNDPSFYTRYHIVPPMQHSMGAAAGIAVQDTQW